jgi:hypothetical protein
MSATVTAVDRTPATAVLVDFRNRHATDILEAMFDKINLLNDVHGRTAYLRSVMRESTACDDNFNRIVTTCNAASIVIQQRSAFRMGVCLGLLIAEDMSETDR